MKRTVFLLGLVCSILVVSCDKIDDPFEKKNTVNPIDTSNSGDMTFTNYSDTNVLIRKILIEDFTGHTCGNCPSAALIAKQLKDTYGDTVLVTGVHSGGFALPKNYPDGKYATDFRTEAGDEYNTTWGNDIAGNPNGFVSRSKIINNNIIIQPSSWGAAIEGLKVLPADIKMELGINYNSTSRNLSAYVKVKGVNDLDGTYNLILYVIEDHIIDWQKDYSLPSGQQDVSNYEHNHVLRDAINGTWGTEIISGSLKTGGAVSKTFNNYLLSSDWNASNCHVIAYVYDASTYEIIQAEEVEMNP